MAPAHRARRSPGARSRDELSAERCRRGRSARGLIASGMPAPDLCPIERGLPSTGRSARQTCATARRARLRRAHAPRARGGAGAVAPGREHAAGSAAFEIATRARQGGRAGLRDDRRRTRWTRSTRASSTCRSSWEASDRRALAGAGRKLARVLRSLGSQLHERARAHLSARPRASSRARRPSPSRARLARALAADAGRKRATVIGAGSFGTALAVLLARGGLRTTLQARTAEQAASLETERENRVYLPGVELPAQLRIEPAAAGRRARRLRVPGRALERARRGDRDARGGRARQARGGRLGRQGPRPAGRAAADERAQREVRRRARRLPGRPRARPGDGARGRRAGGRLRSDEELARALAQVFTRAGVVCEQSNDPLGVELAGAAKNAAALAAGATEAQGLNAAGAAAGHIFAEVLALRRGTGRAAGVDDRARRGRRPGRHGARAREPQPPRRRAAGRGRARPRRSPRGSARRSRRWSRCRCSRGVTCRRRARRRARARHQRPRPADLGRAAARRLGRAGARHRAAARRWRRRPQPGFWRRAWRRASDAHVGEKLPGPVPKAAGPNLKAARKFVLLFRVRISIALRTPKRLSITPTT